MFCHARGGWRASTSNQPSFFSSFPRSAPTEEKLSPPRGTFLLLSELLPEANTAGQDNRLIRYCSDFCSHERSWRSELLVVGEWSPSSDGPFWGSLAQFQSKGSGPKSVQSSIVGSQLCLQCLPYFCLLEPHDKPW